MFSVMAEGNGIALGPPMWHNPTRWLDRLHKPPISMCPNGVTVTTYMFYWLFPFHGRGQVFWKHTASSNKRCVDILVDCIIPCRGLTESTYMVKLPKFNSLCPDNACMRQLVDSSLVPLLVSWLFGAKLSSEPGYTLSTEAAEIN